MSARRAYVRPMRGWWRRDPFFIRYLAREATSVAVAAYAVVLLVGLARLAQGEAAFSRWLEALRSPLSLAFHAVLLGAFALHTWSWFRIMPKTLPRIVVAGRPVPAAAITAAGIAASLAASALMLAAFAGLAR